MTTTRHGSGGALTFLAAAFVLLVACLLGPSAARAQWTQPDASNNISNTNTGNVGVGTTIPGFRFEVRGSSSRNIAGFIGDGDTVGYAGFRIGAFTTTGIANNRTSAFNFHMRKDNWYGGDASGPSFIIETVSKAGGFAAPFMIAPNNDVILNGGVGASGLSYGRVGVGTASPSSLLHLNGSSRPTLTISDAAARARLFRTAGTQSDFSHNVNFDGTGWALDDTAAGGSSLSLGANFIAFNQWGAGSGYRTTTTPLYINATGGVGVGTVSPGAAYKLDVAGSVNASGLCLGGSCRTDWAQVGGQWTAGASSSLNYTAGNVGIGTASAPYPLTVRANTNIAPLNLVGGTGNIEIWKDGTPTKAVAFGAAIPGAAAGGDIQLSTYGGTAWATRMTILNSNGNVGIGTTSPTQLLDVNGAGDIKARAAGGNSASLQLQEASGATTWSEWQQYADRLRLNTHDGVTLRADLVNILPTGAVGIGTASPTSRLHVGGQADNLFQVVGTGSAATDAIANFSSAAGNILMVRGNGNVGVGTAAPASQLFVGGGTPSVATLPGLNVALGGNSYVSASNGAINTFLGSDISSYGIVGTLSNHPLGLRANNTLALTVMPDGKVGIGTTAPAHRLDVSGNVNASGLCLGGTCKSTWAEISGTGGGGSGWTDAGATVSLSNSSAHVGIGTSSPSAKLHIISADDTVAPALSVRQDTNPLFGFDVTLDTNVNGNLSFNRINNGASATMLTLDRAGGGVGIGTAAPTQMLDVSGPGEVKARAAGTISAAIQLHESNGTSSWSEWQQYFDRLRLNTNDGTTTRPDVLSILPNGNVGIGKAAPTVALDVEGSIKATGSVSATYQDVAEWVPSAQKLAAGTVVVLDTGNNNHVVASATPYDTKVAGVVSAQPGLILGVGGEGRVMVATTGRVRVRVDATRGAIKVGDLLVTGEVAGVAMKSVPVDLGGTPIHRPGTIVGKALEPLKGGVGEILVLLSLQ